MAENTEAEIVARLAEDGTEPHDLGAGLVGVRDHTGRLVVTDLVELRGDPPRVKVGAAIVHDARSFVAYVDKHRTAETEAWADLKASTVTAVLDAHGPVFAGHRQHTVTLTCRATRDWTAWRQQDRHMMAQVEFAEFIQDQLRTIVAPPAADMLELAQTFSARREVEYAPSTRLNNGATQLHYRDTETTAAGGRNGDITIPDTFQLGIQVYEGGPNYRVDAQLRYRLREGTLTLGYVLQRPDDIQSDAFAKATEEVAAGIAPTQVWFGTPPR